MPRYENPPYYITAYGLAVKRGYRGSLDEWIASLKGEKGDQGDKVELRYQDEKIQWRWIRFDGSTETPEEVLDAEAEGVPEEEIYQWRDLVDIAEIRGQVVEATLEEARSYAESARVSETHAADYEQRAGESARGAAEDRLAAENARDRAENADENAGVHERNARESAVAAHGFAEEAEASAASVNAQEIWEAIEGRGNSLYKDPETGLVYLMSGERKLGDCVPVGAEGGKGLAFNGGYKDEEGYLHLTMDGAELDPSVFEPILIGTGDGSGGGFGSTMRLTCGLDSRFFSIMDTQKSCVIPYTWSSVDTEDGTETGSGTATWTVNGSRAANQKVNQGENSFDIRDFLTNGAENEILLTVSDAYGNSKKLPFSITVTSFSLSWNLTDMANHRQDPLDIRLTPTGSGDKTVKVSVDGVEVYSQVVSTTGRTVTNTIGSQSHGAHTILAWMEMTVAGETLKTEALRHVGVWTWTGNRTPIVAVLEPEVTVPQYSTVTNKYMVIDPKAETAAVELKAGGKTVTVVTVDRGVQAWAYKPKAVGTETLSVVCGGVSADIRLNVTSLGYDIHPITAGLVMDIDPAGHSNLETGRGNFGYTDGDGVNHPFTFSPNFDWTNGGFRQDEDGVTAFVVKRGTFVTADRSLFDDNAKTNGKEIKIIFKTDKIRKIDTEVLNCMSGNVGIQLKAHEAEIGSELERMKLRYYDGKKIEMDINIEAESENSLAMVCMKSVPSCPPVQYGKADSWTQAAPALLRIGSQDCDIWIYRMKMYGNSLNRYEILDNYIADCADTEEMAARFDRNDILNDDGSINLSKLAGKNARMRVAHLWAKKMTTGKKDKVTADIEIVLVAGGETHHLIARDVEFFAQGTSSLEYILAALNLDVDFSVASSWVDGNGNPIKFYAMTEDSIPVDYFNFKANTASSESAHNVVLTDEYNTYNPFRCAAKRKDPRVRDTIEGHPCAMFFTNTADTAIPVGARTVAPGETILYFMGDMNNSKKNFAVFGQDNDAYPEQCCVEILNNTNLQCRFKSDDLSGETWDGDGNFEFRFPKNPTPAMKESFQKMLSWVVSTDRTQATGAQLPSPVIIGDESFANDTAEYRAAKFVAEFENCFIKDQMTFHYLFTDRHGMMDNRAKNVFLCYEYVPELGEYRWCVRCDYDNDTAEGIDNSGNPTFHYGIEDTDKVGDAWAFNASDSVLWCNIRDLMFEDLKKAYIALKSKGAWDCERIKKKFNDYQAAVPELVRIEDAWNKYILPLLLKGEKAYLAKCGGTREDDREQYETLQGAYTDSRFCDVTDKSGAISLRANTESAEAGSYTGRALIDMYRTTMYGNGGSDRKRVKGGELFTQTCPADSLSDTETYIFDAEWLTEISSLASMKPKFVVLTPAKRIQRIAIGSSEAGYENRNMNALSLGNNDMLEYLDLRGLPKLTQLLDMSALISLEEIYANGSGITGATFGRGAPLTIARLPAVTSLTARDLPKLETFVMDGKNLASIWVENAPEIDTLALCKAAKDLNRGRLIGVDWQDENADVLTRLAGLQTAGGIDGQGNTVDGFVLTGKAHCAVITQVEIDTITAAFPDLTLSWGQIVDSHTVTFKENGRILKLKDGSDAVFTVRHGGTAPNPVAAGLALEPTKAPTVGETFAFTGWDTPLTGIVMDTVINAVFAASVRYYTVRHWYDEAESSLLQEDLVPAYGKCSYTGGQLTRSDGAVWMGWDDVTGNVQADMDIHALFVLPVLPDSVPAEYDYLYSNDPADNSAYAASEFYGILYYGRERDYFAKGDRIKLVCSTSKFADTAIILELRSYKHFQSAERQGMFAGPYFGMIGVMNADKQMNNVNSNAGGMPAMTMPDFLENVVLPGLPQFFITMIEKIVVLSSAGNTSPDIVSMEAHLTLESQAELGFDTKSVPYCNEVAEGADEVTFSCYTDGVSKIKKRYNGEGSAASYWLRSPLASSTTYFCIVASNGTANSNSATASGGVAFGFCLRSNISE